MYRLTHLASASPELRSGKRLTASLISCCLIFFLAGFARAGSATWKRNARSGDWNTKTNWTPAHVPNASTDTATFALSNTTNVSISENTEVNGVTFTAAALNPYTITASLGLTLTLSGVGITNNSGAPQNFVTAVDASNHHGFITFANSATAGSGTSFINSGGETMFGSGGGVMLFHDSSTAGSATITNNGGMINFQPGGGGTIFANTSTAANAIITNSGGEVNGAFDGGFTRFVGSSTAGSAKITNNAGSAQGAGAGVTYFDDSSSAGNGTFTNNPSTSNVGFDGGSTRFGATSSAANGTFTNNGAADFGSESGFTSFGGTAANGTFINNGGTGLGGSGGFTVFHAGTAANGTFINNGGTVAGAGGGFTVFIGGTAANGTFINNGGMSGGQGGALFFDRDSTGGTSRVEVFGNGKLDLSPLFPLLTAKSVTIGSIEGDGNVFLGARNLTVGSNNLSTIFSGVIQDGGQNGGTGGSLTKIGTGTLDLTGANTHTGNTIVNGGVLKIDGSITSNNTHISLGGTLAGTGTISRSVNNAGGMVSPGDAPGTLTVNGNYTQTGHGTLLIDIGGSATSESSLLDVLGTVSLTGGPHVDLLEPVLLNGFVPKVGESFTFLDYASLTGTFLIPNANIDNAMEHWEVTYQATHAILTVAPGNVPIIPVSDHGSTLLLLMLSLLGLGSSRHLLRKEP